VTASPPSSPPPAPRLAAVLVAAASLIVIVGIAITAFFNPLWIDLAQERAGVAAITGYSPQEVREATGSILADLILGPPEFDVEVRGEPVLGPTERGHMVDVRGVVLPFLILFVVVAVAFAITLVVNRHRAWFWRAVGWGSTALVVAAVVIGLAVTLFFDAAFLLFHLIFFPQGNFMFDPATQRLVQLFPQPFWIESATGIVIVGLVLALATALIARRMRRRATQR